MAEASQPGCTLTERDLSLSTGAGQGQQGHVGRDGRHVVYSRQAMASAILSFLLVQKKRTSEWSGSAAFVGVAQTPNHS